MTGGQEGVDPGFEARLDGASAELAQAVLKGIIRQMDLIKSQLGYLHTSKRQLEYFLRPLKGSGHYW